MLLTRRLIIVGSLSTVRTKKFLPFFHRAGENFHIISNSRRHLAVLCVMWCDVLVKFFRPHLTHIVRAQSPSHSASPLMMGVRGDDHVDDGNSIEGRGVWGRSLYIRVGFDLTKRRPESVSMCVLYSSKNNRVHGSCSHGYHFPIMWTNLRGIIIMYSSFFYHRFPSSSVLTDR